VIVIGQVISGPSVNNIRLKIIGCFQIGIGIILFLATFFRGLYFDEETLNFLVLIGIITGVIAFLKFQLQERFYRLSFNFMDLGFIGLVLWYILCIPFAVSTGDAILSTIRILGYACLFYSACQLHTKQSVRIGTWILATTGATLTLVGIGSSVGLPQVSGSWGTALSSAFQYHNALGGYLLMVIPVSTLLYREAKEGWQRYVAVSLLYLNLLGFVASQSRGAYVFFVIVILLVFLSFGKKDIPLVTLLGAGLWGAIDNWTQIAWAGNMKSFLVFLWPMAGLLGMMFTEWLWHGIKERNHRRKIQLAGVGILLGILILGTFPLLAPAWGGGKATKSVVTQIQSIDPQDHNFQERLTFYQDAMKMVRERPLFGFGGNGWVAAYKGYQSYLYSSKETHSEPMKILVEAGIPGMIFYAFIWLGFLMSWLKTWRGRRENWNYIIGVSLIGIFLHSLMDFDLSESSIFFTMVILLAMMRKGWEEMIDRGECPESLTEQPERGNYSYWRGFARVGTVLLVLLGAVLISVSINLKDGLHHAALAADSLSAGHYDETIQESQTALNYFPYQARVYANLAQAELAKGSEENKRDLYSSAVEHAEQAVSLNSTDPTLRSVAARVYSLTGSPQRAYQEAKEGVELASLTRQKYEESAQYALGYAENLIESGKKEEAKQILNEVIDLPGQVDDRFDQLSKQRRMWRSGILLTATPGFQIYHAEALGIMGQRTYALNELENIRFDKDYGCAALLLKGVIEERQGNNVRGSEAIRIAQHAQPQLKDSVATLRKLMETNF
jgi:tetratricopeptide (TPR) repeat protein